MLLLLVGGVWADRLPRHQLMVATDVVRFGLHALLAALIFAGDVPLWQIATIEALFGAAMAFSRPAYTGLLPQTVPEEDIQPAQALTGITNTVSQFLGPALATGLVLGLGAGWAFLLDALTFLLSAAFLLCLSSLATIDDLLHHLSTSLGRLRNGVVQFLTDGEGRGQLPFRDSQCLSQRARRRATELGLDEAELLLRVAKCIVRREEQLVCFSAHLLLHFRLLEGTLSLFAQAADAPDQPQDAQHD